MLEAIILLAWWIIPMLLCFAICRVRKLRRSHKDELLYSIVPFLNLIMLIMFLAEIITDWLDGDKVERFVDKLYDIIVGSEEEDEQ